jgi:hypothetical protein
MRNQWVGRAAKMRGKACGDSVYRQNRKKSNRKYIAHFCGAQKPRPLYAGQGLRSAEKQLRACYNQKSTSVS